MEGKDKNFSVEKDGRKIPMFGTMDNIEHLRFGRIRSEFQCFEGQEKNSNIWKNSKRKE